jgi:hypothetical protein
MPAPHRIENELESVLSNPHYSSLFYQRNQFRKPNTPAYTPALIAAEATDSIVRKSPLVNPVEVVEMKGYVELYRAHDGRRGLNSAGTLGQSWFGRDVAETIWKATERHSGAERERWYMEFLRSANFVLPEWNEMLQIACMAVPSGNWVATLSGHGNWKAMRTPPGKTRPGGAPSIDTVDDVMVQLKMLPIQGTLQYLVPFFNDSWVHPVAKGTSKWPFLS